MRYSLVSILALTVLPSVFAESCLNGGGTCMTSSKCLKEKFGSVSTGLCSGGADNRCCDLKGNYQCGTGGKGRCKYTSEGCKGTWQSGFCPFGSDFKCCN
ncbi:hypothetical protein C7974DRAFT_387983 [Boeremia exigua]|uniref:uncharacterized protein n=1 Tax=Boeremia exigua TaxID=749465 RepID=UPI001E8DDB90|nr:uncharacterized protein C7974DRAFT_387983 [Boeremia exigua]KAH6639170.1 hypothetical protein C7974DRAFT_387983 [Boeremia exigua]